MSTLDRAIAIAVQAHSGEKDRIGEPYILHPLRVMLAVDTEDEMIAAALHDVVEDSDWTLEDLRREGFSEHVVYVVDLLTKPDDGSMTYEQYVERVKQDPVAVKIKYADLADNSNPERLNKLPSAKRDQLSRKYARAKEILNS